MPCHPFVPASAFAAPPFHFWQAHLIAAPPFHSGWRIRSPRCPFKFWLAHLIAVSPFHLWLAHLIATQHSIHSSNASVDYLIVACHATNIVPFGRKIPLLNAMPQHLSIWPAQFIIECNAAANYPIWLALFIECHPPMLNHIFNKTTSFL